MTMAKPIRFLLALIMAAVSLFGFIRLGYMFVPLTFWPYVFVVFLGPFIVARLVYAAIVWGQQHTLTWWCEIWDSGNYRPCLVPRVVRKDSRAGDFAHRARGIGRPRPKVLVGPQRPAQKLAVFPSTFFMPYCVCPSCETEGLHWMARSDISDVTRTCRDCGHQWGQNVGLS